MNRLVPFVSTYVKYVGYGSPGLTPGKVYSILGWEEEEDSCLGTHRFSIKDDDESLRRMVIPREDFEDYSFIRNLKGILS